MSPSSHSTAAGLLRQLEVLHPLDAAQAEVFLRLRHRHGVDAAAAGVLEAYAALGLGRVVVVVGILELVPAVAEDFTAEIAAVGVGLHSSSPLVSSSSDRLAQISMTLAMPISPKMPIRLSTWQRMPTRAAITFTMWPILPSLAHSMK